MKKQAGQTSTHDSPAGDAPSSQATKDEAEEKVPIRNYWRILSFGGRIDHALLLLALGCALGSGVALPLMNIVFGSLAGDFNSYFIPGSGVTEKQFKQSVNRNALYIVYLFIGSFALSYISTVSTTTGKPSTWLTYPVLLSNYRTSHFSGIATYLSGSVVRSTYQQAGPDLDRTVSNTITSSSNSIQASISDRLALLFQGLALIISAYAIAFCYSWALTLVVSSALFFIVLVLSLTAPPVIRMQQSIDKADAKHASIAGEIFGSIRTVFSLGAEAPLSKRYSSWVNESKRRGLRLAPHVGAQLAPVFFSIYASFALAFWFGLKLYREGNIGSIKEVIIVTMSVLIVVSILGNIVQPIMMIIKAISASKEFFDMIDSKGVRVDGKTSPAVSAHEDLVLTDVTFAYPTRPGVQVLKQFSARFEKGKTTALVGPSGSGKSTVVALLERWYEVGETSDMASRTEEPSKEAEDTTAEENMSSAPAPEVQTSSGSITCGGEDITSFNIKWWRTQIGLVQQEPFLFNDSIFSNVAAGLLGTQWQHEPDDVKLDLVREACKEAFADEFIERLPDKYSTMVGESGIKLSAGQRQRLAIARSIVGRPAILILDETTSSIDVRSERIVQDALDRVSENRTTVVIAHRLATVRNAEHIIVLHDGWNIEEGSHEQLLAKDDGLYCSLVHAQQLQQISTENETKFAKVEMVQLEESVLRQSDVALSVQQQANPAREKLTGFFRTVGVFVYEQRRYWPLYLLLLAGVSGAGAAFSLQSWFFAQLVGVFRLTGPQLVHAGNLWSLLFFVLSLGEGVAYFTIGLSSIALSTYFACAYRKDYFSNILCKPIPFFDHEDNSSGALMSRLSTDPKQIQELLGINGAFPMISISGLVGCIAISFAFGWKLTLVTLFAAMPVLLVSQFIRHRHEIEFEKKNSAVFAESSTFSTEAVSAMRTVISLTMEDQILKRYRDMLQQQIKESTHRASYAMLVVALCYSVAFLAMALTFWYGGQLLASHEYGPT